MANPTLTAQNEWLTQPGQDFLQLSTVGSANPVSWIDSTGALHGGFGSGIGANGVVYVSTACSGSPNCFQVGANTRWVADGGITSGQPVVTSNTIAFTSADVGRSIYTINPGTGLTKLIGTILSVQSSISATVNVNATATETNDILCVGTDDTAQLQAAWNYAVANGGLTVYLPGGAMLVSGQPFVFTGTANPKGSYGIVGTGGYGSGTVFVMSPGYNFAGMQDTHGMLYDFVPSGGSSNTPSGFHIWPRVAYFSVTALGSIFNGAASPSALIYNAATIQDIQVAGFSGLSNMVMIIVGTEARLFNVNLQPNFALGSSNTPLIENTNGASYIDIYSPILAYSQGYALSLQGCISCNIYGGIIVSTGNATGSNPHASVNTIGSTNVRFFGTRFNGGPTGGTEPALLFVDATSEVELIGARFENAATGSNAIWVASGGKLHMKNVDLSAVSGSAVGINNLGTVFDEGGNVLPVSSAPYLGTGVLVSATGRNLSGICTGVASSSSTLGLYGTGPNQTTTTCTSTVIGTGTPVQSTGTLGFLTATASAGGVNASSGVVTVLVNGSPSTITCTLGTSTNCQDGIHFVSLNAGDRVSLQFTTQAGETLAGVQASVLWF
jgi:hypothetical protein